MGGRAAKVITLGAVAFAVVAALGLSTAAATRIVKIASHITIRNQSLTFSGKVKSHNSGCLNDRKVTLYRTNGNVLGSTHTNRHGHWKITPSGSAGISLGRFFARVKRESQGAAGTIYVCKGARSRTIHIDNRAGAPHAG